MSSSYGIAERVSRVPGAGGELRIVYDPGELDRAEWTRFVDAHPNGTAFQRPEMLDVYAATRRDKPALTAMLRADGSLAGVLLGVEQRSLPGPLGAVTARVIVWGGPLLADDDPQTLAALLRGHDRGPGRRAVYTQFRHLWDTSASHSTFAAAGYEYEDHLDVIIDLSQGIGALWKRIKSRRKNIKRAEREGIECREINNEADLQLAHEYIQKVYTRIRLPVPHRSYFHAIEHVLRPAGLARYFGAYHQDRLVAARIVLCHRRWMYDFWAAGDDSVAKLQGGTMLPWAICQWGVEHGFRVYDFGGAGKPGVPYGVRDYKLSYGGDLVCFGRHTRMHRPWVYQTGAAAIRLLRATARRR